MFLVDKDLRKAKPLGDRSSSPKIIPKTTSVCGSAQKLTKYCFR